MAHHSREESRAFSASAEKQMRQRLLGEEVEKRLTDEQQKAAQQLREQVRPYIALSREAGAAGEEIARLVGEKLGVEVFDRELIDVMAEKYHVPTGMIEFVDETTSNWLHEIFSRWLDSRTISQEKFVTDLGKTVLFTAHRKPAVFVGRGAQFFLPGVRGIAVRIVAPEGARIQHVMAEEGVSHEEASRAVKKADLGRREFVQKYFLHDIDDSALYDIVVNAERTGLELAADMIVTLYRHRFGAELSS